MSFYSWSYKTDRNLVGCNISWPLPRGQRGVSDVHRWSITSGKECSFKEKEVMCCWYEVPWLQRLGDAPEEAPAARTPRAPQPQRRARPAGLPLLPLELQQEEEEGSPWAQVWSVHHKLHFCWLLEFHKPPWLVSELFLTARPAGAGWFCVSWATLVSGGRAGHCLLTGRSCEGIGSWGCNNCASKVPLIHSELTTCCFLHLARLPYCFPFVAFECFLSFFQRLECFK